MAASGTNRELLVELRRGTAPLRAQLETGLRDAVRSGRLTRGERMPATRVLAADLGVSRRLVVEAYAQLVAEGYLVARRGSGTTVSSGRAAAVPPTPERPARPLRFDFFPGSPDLASFPRAAWLRALRDALRTAPDAALGYPDERGAPELRAALAAHLGRTRGVATDPTRVVVCAGAAQGLGLVARALGPGARIAVEDPTLPEHRSMLEGAGAEVVPIGVDAHGLLTGALERAAVDAVVVTPAHQSPTGVALAPDRRAALAAWAREGRLVVEDDYDAEFRYDRPPIGALQGLAPEHVAYLGSASKSLAPALRLGWLALPADLVAAVARERRLADRGTPTLDQLALAGLLDSGAFDRHLRAARRTYAARRSALAAALDEHLPGARLEGMAAGLHAVVRLPVAVDEQALLRAAARRSVGVYPLGWGYAQPQALGGALVLGYACLAEPAIREGIRLLAEAVAELSDPASAPGASARTP